MVPLGISGLTGFGGSQSDPQYAILNTYDITDDIYYTRGKHALRFGTLLNKYNNGMQQADNRTGSLSFQPRSVLEGIPYDWTGQGNGWLQSLVETICSIPWLLCQDDWRALRDSP